MTKSERALKAVPAPRDPVEIIDCTHVVNGLRIGWRDSGPADGHPIVMIHGLVESSRTWDKVTPYFNDRYRVIAIDLLGHGASSAPIFGADYSIPALATHVRDLLLLESVDHATVVGHSLGGGVALQLAYLWPKMVSRLVLEDSGGLGRSVSPLLRMLAIPGLADPFVHLAVSPRTVGIVRKAAELAGMHQHGKVEDWLRAAELLATRSNRRAVLSLIRGVIGSAGQRVSAADRLHITAHLPVLVMWGERDSIIPVGHARRAERMMPGARVEYFPNSGHFPHLDDPKAFAELVHDFLDTTKPARNTLDDLADVFNEVPVLARRDRRVRPRQRDDEDAQ